MEGSEEMPKMNEDGELWKGLRPGGEGMAKKQLSMVSPASAGN